MTASRRKFTLQCWMVFSDDGGRRWRARYLRQRWTAMVTVLITSGYRPWTLRWWAATASRARRKGKRWGGSGDGRCLPRLAVVIPRPSSLHCVVAPRLQPHTCTMLLLLSVAYRQSFPAGSCLLVVDGGCWILLVLEKRGKSRRCWSERRLMLTILTLGQTHRL